MIFLGVACGKGAVSWDGTLPGDGPGPGSGGGAGALTQDLPCDVADLLSRECAGCHGASPAQGLLRLATRADLAGAPPVGSWHTVADWALQRMDAGEMPPAGYGYPPLPASGVALFKAWIASGLGAGTCGVTASPDAGVWTPPDAGPIVQDLPCDVAQVLSDSCAPCHGPVLRLGATRRLMTRSDLAARPPAGPWATMAEWALDRIGSGSMPPVGYGVPAVTDAGLQALQAWVAGGLDAGTCGVSPGADGGGWTPPDAGPVDAGSLAGLPCDVAALVASRCAECHAPGRPQVSLVSLADFRAPSPTVSGLSLGQVAAQKLVGGTMPPVGYAPATPSEVAGFTGWVDAGMPTGTCGAVDAGVGDGGYALTCASGRYWDAGTVVGQEVGSPDMNPGLPCLACHWRPGSDTDKRYVFAGTIFPGLHEQDLCIDPAAPGGTLEIRDGAGNVLTLQVSANRDLPGISPLSGNFRSGLTTPIQPPFTARLYRNGRVAEMVTPQTNGDCNACHSENGDGGAYGRIVWP